MLPGHALDHHVAAELAGQHDQRAVEQPALLQVEDQLGDRAVDLLLHLGVGGVAVLVRVPAQERDVLGRHLDEARPGLGQPPGQQAALAEPAGVVAVEALLRLLGQVEGVALRRVEQAVGVVHGAQHRLLVVVAGQARQRALLDQPPVGLLAAGEPLAGHPLGRADGGDGVERVGQVERAVLAAEEPGGGERLQLLRLADAPPAAGRC